MKVSLLKYLRKRYMWKWDVQLDEWILLDHKLTVSKTFYTRSDLLEYIMPWWYPVDFKIRTNRRIERKWYFRRKRQFF